MSNRTTHSHDGERALSLATLAIHGGQSPDPSTGAVMPPIYATSTYAQSSPGEHQGFEYSRTHNPTRFAYERCVAALEGGTRAYAFASGMAATSTVMELLDAGSHVVAMDDLYGGTFRLFERVRRRTAGLDFSFVDLTDPAAFEAAIRPDTKMVWIETPTNPMLKLVDIAAIAEIARKRGLLIVVDNTFASPMLQRPLSLGADIVVHSATKYLNGHSDMVGGIAVVGDNAELAEQMAFLQNSIGGVQGPFDSFLALRGLKTLRCACGRTAKTHWRLRNGWKPTLRSKRSFTPALPRTRNMRSRRARCPASAASSPSSSRAASTQPSVSAKRPNCSPWPNRSVVWKAW